MSLSKDDIKKLKSDYNLAQSQINDFSSFVQDYPSTSKEDLLEIYRNAGYDIAKAREQKKL
jgi:hypothetical protein